MTRYVDPKAAVSLENDGKCSYKQGRMHARATEWSLRYRVAIPKTGRLRLVWYRVYVSEGHNPTPFIIVRGERRYLTPELAEKVTVP